MAKQKLKHLHFLGIFGHAMRGVAYAAKQQGNTVTGTDDGAYPPADWLNERGITWWQQPDPHHLDGVGTVIISGHIQPDHPEVVTARERDIPIISFPQFIYELTEDHRRIVIAGTHGKTTTTSLVTWLLEAGGQQPDYLVGIKPHNFESSVRLAGSKVIVLEGDEYRSSQFDTVSKFSYYRPHVLALTSVEMDHPDFFKGLDDIQKRFQALVADVPADGQVYYWQGSDAVRDAITAAQAPTASYDFAAADWWADGVSFTPDGIRFTLRHHQESFGVLSAPLYGKHNVLNTTVASAIALAEGVSFEDIQSGLESFKGATRRFERVSASDAAVRVLDDYAHHPTEVRTTIEAAKLHFGGRVIAMFKPHTYSRTKELLKEYQASFEGADAAFIAEIEPARESQKERTVSGVDIARKAGEQVQYVAERSELLEQVAGAVKPGDTVLCMSVNGFDSFAEELAEQLAAKFSR